MFRWNHFYAPRAAVPVAAEANPAAPEEAIELDSEESVPSAPGPAREDLIAQAAAAELKLFVQWRIFKSDGDPGALIAELCGNRTVLALPVVSFSGVCGMGSIIGIMNLLCWKREPFYS